jgi:sulfocyanin
MMITRTMVFTAAVAFTLTACGGGDQAPEAPPATEPAAPTPPPAPPETFGMPSWMQVDQAARTVTIQLTAGSTTDNNHWNYNGYFGGRGGITVPTGYTVTVNFVNQDPAMVHSFGIQAPMATYPNQFTEMTPVFEGAVTSNPGSMTDGTMPGESEDVTFVAGAPGEYVLVCYVVGHAATGMWMDFIVSADETAGAMM